MGNTGADFHKAFESSCSTLYILFVLCENRSSLSHSLTLCVLWLSPELEFEERNEKKELNTRNSAKILLDHEREALSVERWRGHTQMDSHIRIGWLTKTGLETQSKLKSVRSEFTRRSFFFLCASCELLSFFFALFSRWTRFFMLHRARGEWRDLNSHARWRQIDFFSCK